jgi:anaerobic magnesium-protoporphyrin IX monomethyl ester cyclase
VPALRSRPRLLLLHPKTLIDSWPFPVDTLGEVIKVPAVTYPLLAATVADLDIEIEIFDGYVARESFRDYKARLARADIVAISAMTPLKALDTELTVRLARALNPNVRVILGGNHASAFPEAWIARGVDYVIVREGEAAFPQLVRAIVEGDGDAADVPNLVYRDRHGRAARSRTTADRVQLDATPLPAWERFDLRPYSGFGAGGPAATVEVSRGCPHRCDFCNINQYWNYTQRYKSVERVLEELDRLARLGVRQVFFGDDNFGHDHAHTLRLLEAIVRRPWKMALGAFIRGDTISRHPEFLPLASKAGLRIALMGIETLSREWLKEHKKGVGARDVRQWYRDIYGACRRHRVFLIGLFITAPDAPFEHTSGAGANGQVCDFHYSADLVAQRGSALFDQLSAVGSVAKDMFYHDWNLPSIAAPAGTTKGSPAAGRVVQRSRKTFSHLAKNIDAWVVRGLLSPDRVSRHVWWRNVGVMIERLACTRPADVARYRTARDEQRPLADRQSAICGSVLNDDVLRRLTMGERWRAPLSWRCGS